ncbi:MAG: hypothetical protein HQL77_17800 [Magnetococcales bacterium]|nr:hypothetical protein [Magnetococcales bacterium]
MEPDMNVSPQVLLIDLDNCPKEVEKLPQTLSVFFRIIVCYGGIEPKVPLGLVTVLATAIHEGKLELIGMKRGGKNAADFGLAFYAGRLVSEAPEEAEFTILSDDTDLDHVVDLLSGSGRKAKRLNSKKSTEKPGNVQFWKINGHDLLDNIIEQYVETHILSKNAKPAKKTTLASSIKRAFPVRNGVSTDTIINALQERNILKIDPKGKVTYLLQKNSKNNELDLPENNDNIPF